MAKLNPILYMQTDPKWANNDYSAKGEKTTIKAEGCGIACSAMVIASLVDKKVTPEVTAKWSLEHGYKALKQGTYYSYFKPQFAEYGIKCNMMNSVNCYGKPNDPIHKKVRKTLEDGNWIISVAGKGDFTSSGHYILVYGLDGDNVLIKDPYNTKAICSKMPWDRYIKQQKYYWEIEIPAKYKEDDELIVRENIIVDGEEYTVDMINKDGYTYIKTRDIGAIFGYNISNKGGTPILDKKK